jgi:Ser/Thr protein kinase RdoA (MazF antagonist)
MIDLLEQLLGAPVTLERLKVKDGRRRTLYAQGARRSAIVKVYASDRASVVASRIAALAAGPPEPVVPSLLHLDSVRHLVLLSEVPGRPVRESLLEGDLAACWRVGGALGRWHAAWLGRAPVVLREHTVDREVEILRSRAAAASPSVARAVESALMGLRGDWAGTTVVHRDLYEEQILVDERIGLIDLDDAAIGPPELDLGNLRAHLELLELRRNTELVSEWRALLRAYMEAGPALDDALLDRCRRLTLLRLACLIDDVRLVDKALGDWVPA